MSDFTTDPLGWVPPTTSPLACDRAMVTHSTELQGFTAGQIIQAARADFLRRDRNRSREKRRAEMVREMGAEYARRAFGPPERYAFAAAHAETAATPRTLIELALSAPTVGEQTGIPATMRLYRSVGALREALAVIEGDAPTLPPEPADEPLPLS